MHPTVKDGDTITIEPVPLSEVTRGDIILYRSGMGVTAHRLIRIETRKDTSPRFILRGDTLGSPIELVHSQDVLGRVVCVERRRRLIDPYSWKAKVCRATWLFLYSIKREIRAKTALFSPFLIER
jgi:hypothetical protein